MDTLFSLKNKTALVIGGSRRLDKGMAAGLAAAGAGFILGSRSQKDLETLYVDGGWLIN